MRYRIYFEAPDGTKSTREVEAPGTIVRVCDDHGRIVESKPWPKDEGFVVPPTTQPLYQA